MPYLDLFPYSELYYGALGRGWKRLTINPSVSEASVTFVANNKLVIGNSVWVPSGTSVTYVVRSDGYLGVQDSVVVDNHQIINVTLSKGYVMVGNNGAYAVSKDGDTWTTGEFSPISSRDLYGVAYGKDRLIACYDYGILISVDGVHWTTKLGFPGFRNVKYVNNNFCLTGSANISFSENGDIWTTSSTDSIGNWKDVMYVSGSSSKYIIVGDSGYIGTSETGDSGTWTAQQVGTTWYNSVTYGNSKYVAVGADTTNSKNLSFSSDGSTWTNSVLGLGTENWYGVTYANDTFVAVGSGTSNNGIAAYSSDGESWTVDLQSSGVLTDVIYDGTQFIASGFGKVCTSPDGTIWTSTSVGTSSPVWRGITYSE